VKDTPFSTFVRPLKLSIQQYNLDSSLINHATLQVRLLPDHD
jgi:hypothetical protein